MHEAALLQSTILAVALLAGCSGSGTPNDGSKPSGGTSGGASGQSNGGSTRSGGVLSGGGSSDQSGGGLTGRGGAISSAGEPRLGGSNAAGAASGSAETVTTGGAAAGGTNAAGGATSGGAAADAGPPASCSSDLSSRVRITETDVGVAYAYNEVDNNGAALGLTPLALSPVPGGGTRVAFLGQNDNLVHVVTLDANDHMVAGSLIGLTGYDVQDIYADASGGVLLVSRNALGSTANNNCGDINNLCGLVSAYPTAASCYDMYMVRFDGSTETWATKLTDTTASLPAYGLGATSESNVIFIWSEYAHNGRIAFDGSNYAAYFGAAITVPNQACVGSSTLTTGVNIHQGDRMKLVNENGALQPSGFDWGCSHSGYERVVWDPTGKFVPVCKNDAPTGGKSGQLAFAPDITTIYPIDLYYSDLGSVMMAGGGGYWIISSDIRAGQTPNTDGLADVHLLHVASTSAPTPDNDTLLVSDSENDRAPHLAAYGSNMVLAAWEESTAPGDLAQNDSRRQMYLQILDSTKGTAPTGSTTASAGPLKLSPNVLGSRYQDFRAFPDGSAAYAAPGAATTIKILRVLPCS